MRDDLLFCKKNENKMNFIQIFKNKNKKKCSAKESVVKFMGPMEERVCDVCYEVLHGKKTF